MRLGHLGGALVMLLLVGGSAAGQHTSIMVAPGDITWGAPRPNGVQVAILEGNPELPGPFTMRVSVPANWRTAPHTHNSAEYVTVISGTVYAGRGSSFDAAQMKELAAGGFMIMPAQEPHFLMAREPAVIQVQGIGPLVVTFVNPADDPSKK